MSRILDSRATAEARRLVVALRDYRVQSFEMIGPNGMLVDREKSQDAADKLKALLSQLN
jgi:hypothetical protein